MDTTINIPDKNYYFLICDTPAIDAKHRIDQLNHMGFIADSNKENIANYFQRFSKSKEPVVFIYQNKIWNLSTFMDQKEFDKLGIKQSYEEIPQLGLNNLMKQQFEDMEFISYNSLELLPDYRKTKGICQEAVRIDPYNIRHIPDYMLSQEIIDTALRLEGNTLQYIPQEKLNAGICHKAVENDFMSLQYVPFKFKSEELCRIAVKGATADSQSEGHRILSHIPYTFICNDAIRQFNNKLSVSGEVMAKAIVNKEVMSDNMCNKLFEWDHNAYKHFPNLYKNKDMTAKAVSMDGTLLAYVPPKQINENLCLAAIKNTYKAMEFVSGDIKTPDFCLKAAQTNGNSIEFIPPAYRSRKICETAVANSTGYDLIKSIPYPDLCLLVLERSIPLKQFSDCARMLPPGIINEEIAYKVAEHGPDCLSMIPEKLMTDNLIGFALKNNPLTLEYIPDKYKTIEICQDAVKRDIKACAYIPESLVTNDLYLDIIKQDSRSIMHIPEERRTPELYLMAVKANSKLAEFVPPSIRKENNIFSFNERIDKILIGKNNLTFEQLGSIYRGNPLLVKEIKSGDKILKNKLLSFDKETDKFTISNSETQKKKKVFNKSI